MSNPKYAGLVEKNRRSAAKARERTYNALFNASTLEEARALFGRTKPDALNRAASRDPELKKRYDELSREQFQSPEARAARSAAAQARGEITRQRAQEKSDILVEEVDFLLSAGAAKSDILRAVRKSYAAFEMSMYRANRPDLIARLKKA